MCDVAPDIQHRSAPAAELVPVMKTLKRRWRPAPESHIRKAERTAWTPEHPAPDVVIYLVVWQGLHDGSTWKVRDLADWAGIGRHRAHVLIQEVAADFSTWNDEDEGRGQNGDSEGTARGQAGDKKGQAVGYECGDSSGDGDKRGQRGDSAGTSRGHSRARDPLLTEKGKRKEPLEQQFVPRAGEPPRGQPADLATSDPEDVPDAREPEPPPQDRQTRLDGERLEERRSEPVATDGGAGGGQARTVGDGAGCDASATGHARPAVPAWVPSVKLLGSTSRGVCFDGVVRLLTAILGEPPAARHLASPKYGPGCKVIWLWEKLGYPFWPEFEADLALVIRWAQQSHDDEAERDIRGQGWGGKDRSRDVANLCRLSPPGSSSGADYHTRLVLAQRWAGVQEGSVEPAPPASDHGHNGKNHPDSQAKAQEPILVIPDFVEKQRKEWRQMEWGEVDPETLAQWADEDARQDWNRYLPMNHPSRRAEA